MKKLILALLIFLAACQRPQNEVFAGFDITTILSRSEPENDLEKSELDMMNKMLADYPGVTATMVWEKCDDVNAYYFPSSKTVHMCEEIENLGQGAVMAAAHETGHAITHQLLSTTGESDADEIGALEMLKYGRHEGVVAQVKWFHDMGLFYTHHIDGDPHPTPAYRAWMLACLELGSRDEVPYCVAMYDATRLKWFMRLQITN